MTDKEKYNQWAKIANKSEDCILFLRQNKLITGLMVEHIRGKLDARKPILDSTEKRSEKCLPEQSEML